jgi:hypothetical protein
MRSVKITFGLVAAIGALALSASSALAHNFNAHIEGQTITEATPGKLKGVGVGNQHFKFGAIKINCPVLTLSKSVVVEEHPEKLKVVAKYKSGKANEPETGCETQIKVGGEPSGLPTKFKTPVEYLFNANGIEGEVGTEFEGTESEGAVEVGASAAEIKVAGISCIVSWPAQKIPLKFKKVPLEIASFSLEEVPNSHVKKFPSGFQKKLLITADFEKMEWSFSEGARCEEFKTTEGTNGSYEGAFLEEVVNGDLTWE